MITTEISYAQYHFISQLAQAAGLDGVDEFLRQMGFTCSILRSTVPYPTKGGRKFRKRVGRELTRLGFDQRFLDADEVIPGVGLSGATIALCYGPTEDGERACSGPKLVEGMPDLFKKTS